MTEPQSQSYPIEISVPQVKQLQDAGETFLFIDCREQQEYDHCRIEGAVLIPMSEIPAKLPEIESQQGKRIVVHCHHGGRSMQVTQYLRQQGLASAQNMAGGIDAWSLEVDSAVPRY